MADNIYLEIDKSNGAILSYSNKKLKSSTSDFIEATEVELDHLNHLEANVFPVGMVATLSDLQDHRAKVQKIAQLKAQLPQSAAKIAQLKVQVAKGQAAVRAAQANKDAFLSAGAAKHGITATEYEAELIAQYAASTAATGAPQTMSREDAGLKLRKTVADAKRQRNK